MIKGKLTEHKIRYTSCPMSSSSIDLFDGNGLELRISSSGSKIWRYRYRIAGVTQILTFGSYPVTTLKEARKQRDKATLLRKAELNPATFEAIPPKSTPIVTFVQLVDEYVNITLAKKPSQKEVKRSLYKDAVSIWGSRDPESITLRECVLLLDDVAKRGPVQSDRLYAYLKRVFKVGMQRGLITVDPMVHVQKPAPEADVRNNSVKVFTHNQLECLVQTINGSPSTMMDDVLLMILWTGARPSEVLKMQWKQIEGEQWILGAKEHKGGHQRPRVIIRPLIDTAMRIIKKYQGLHDQYVFPGKLKKPSSHIRLSRHVKHIRMHYGIREFTPNHLRHTISTRMREIGIRPDIVERVIGHHVDSGVIGVYSSYNWLPEMREALIQWQEWILGE